MTRRSCRDSVKLASTPPSSCGSPERQLPSPLFMESADALTESESNYQVTTSSDTVISGRGIWNSWTRNCSKPFLALLDLLDNAFDATSLKAKGRIVIQADREVNSTRKRNIISGLAIYNALRVNNEKASKTPNLYYYSRQFGRLIRKNGDARDELGLTNGGTNYCQGLTIFLDDESASLPLNPTKQELAFTEQPNGEHHKNNLLAWVNAATRLYYNYFLVCKFLALKKDISKALTEMVVGVNASIARSGTSKSLNKCEFTNFGKFAHSLRNSQIRLIPLKSVEYVRGNDTLLHFNLPAICATSRKRKAPPPNRSICLTFQSKGAQSS